MKNTMPNFNLNENLNFPMMPGNSQQLLNNRNTQRGFYNQQNNLFNGNLLNNNISNSGKMMRNEKISNAFKKDPKYGINSSNIESLIYPAVVQLNIIGSLRAPIPDFMTSYCFSPRSPSQEASSSQIQTDGLKPSDFFAENAIFLIVELNSG